MALETIRRTLLVLVGTRRGEGRAEGPETCANRVRSAAACSLHRLQLIRLRGLELLEHLCLRVTLLMFTASSLPHSLSRPW
jgi:hypothetical protein